MRLPRPARLAALPLVLALGLAACGTDEPADVDTPAPTVTPTTPAPTPTPAPTRSATPTPTEDPGDQIGDGDSEGDDTPATAGGGVCGELTNDEVGAVLGGTVKGSALGGMPGCTFARTDRKAPAVTLIDKAYKSAADMDAAKNAATSAVEGTPESVTGVGTEAFVVTGTSFGGTDVQGAGAVHVGKRLVSITVSQQKGLSKAKVRDLVIRTLKLVVSELS